MRKYCKAYYLKDLRKFSGFTESRINWKEPEAEDKDSFADDDIVYIHEDFTVTKSMWHGESVVFNAVTPEWQVFCETTLGFKIPEDLASPPEP